MGGNGDINEFCGYAVLNSFYGSLHRPVRAMRAKRRSACHTVPSVWRFEEARGGAKLQTFAAPLLPPGVVSATLAIGQRCFVRAAPSPLTTLPCWALRFNAPP